MDATLQSVIAEELGESAVITDHLEEGLINETYRVEHAGTAYIMQVSPSDENLSRGLQCYRLFSRTDLPVPQVVTETVRTRDGIQYTIVEALPGETAHLDISPERADAAGNALAKIHEAVSVERPGWLRFDDGVSTTTFAEGSLRAWRLRKVRDNARYMRENGMDAAGLAVADHFDEITAMPSTEAGEAVLCHNDFSPDNLLFENDTLTGIIDFDHAYAGDRYRDLAKSAVGFWMHQPDADWNVHEMVYEGYRSVAELDEHFADNEPAYRAESLAVTLGGMARLGELTEDEKEFYTDEILAALARIEDCGG